MLFTESLHGMQEETAIKLPHNIHLPKHLAQESVLELNNVLLFPRCLGKVQTRVLPPRQEAESQHSVPHSRRETQGRSCLPCKSNKDCEHKHLSKPISFIITNIQ